MSLEPSDVQKIAHLARLTIEKENISQYALDLSNIFDLVDQMQSANTDDVEPMAHPMHMTQRLREDKVTEKDDHIVLQALAPATEAGLYLVPQVIE